MVGSRIRCQIRTISLDELPLEPYAALSYTWGASSRRRSIDIRVSNYAHQLHVTDNLYRALQGLRSRRGQVLTIWIDAICINQADIRERAEQVTLMSEIYKSADHILVWLGKTGIVSRPLAESVIYWKRVVMRTVRDGDRARRKAPEMESALLNTVPCWLDRAWVMQEVTTKRKIILCYDRRKVEYDRWSLVIAPSGQTRRLFDKLNELRYFAWFGNLGDMDIATDARFKFREAAHLALSADATDPRDKVYSLMGLISRKEAATITPNYQWPPWMVYAQATHADIAYSRRLDILELARQHDTDIEGLPSWSADFSRPSPNKADNLWELRKLCSQHIAGGISTLTSSREAKVTLSADLRELHVHGVELDHLIGGAYYLHDTIALVESVTSIAIDFLYSYQSRATAGKVSSIVPAIHFNPSYLTVESISIAQYQSWSLADHMSKCFEI